MIPPKIFYQSLAILLLVISIQPGVSAFIDNPVGGFDKEHSISMALADPNLNTGFLQNPDIINNENLTDGQKKLSTSLLMHIPLSPPVSPEMQSSSKSGLTIKNVPKQLNSQRLPATLNTAPSGELIYVYVYVKPGYSTEIIDPFAYEVTGRDDVFHLAVAWVDIQNLMTLASVDGVRVIREVVPPEVRLGSVTTEGDAIHRTIDVRSLYGYKGTGMKIGIISDGVNHIADSVNSGDLPPNVHVISDSIGGDEGTAMLEIVHDMVPDAELYFHDYGSDITAFNVAIDQLSSNGCTVICDDVGWQYEPFFEDGVVASHIKNILANQKIVYVSSAGNNAQNHYQGTFYGGGTGGANWMDFSHGGSSFKSLYIDLPPGSAVRVVLEWDDKFESSGNDYNLYLSRYPATSGSFGNLQYSKKTQTGSDDPIEYLDYQNTGSSTIEAQIDIEKYLGNSKTLELFIYTIGDKAITQYSNNLVASDSIFGHPAVPDVIAVAAVPASSPSTIEQYSSLGPVTIRYPTGVSRSKPDISGVDKVSISGAGGFSGPKKIFGGTSASAPHIAAVVAQIWGANPTLTPAQVRGALYTSAVDLGTAGRDTTYGYGRADALAMENLYTPPASITGLNNTTYQPTYINWTWNDPVDADFDRVMVFLNGVWRTNVTRGIRFYNATGLSVNTQYTLGTRTVDITGNVNGTLVTSTKWTAPLTPAPVTPVANFTANTTSGFSPLTVRFTDSTTGSLPLTFQWNFGDGSSNATSPSPIHTFLATVNTTYTVTLTAFNSAGSSSKSSVIAVNVPPVGNPPVANFTTNTTSGLSPLTVQFTDSTTGSLPLTYQWNFGDGSSNSATQNPIHTFSATTNTSYTVTLIASNSAGSSTKSSVITVNLPPVVIPPVANFTINTTSGLSPLTVRFTDSTTGSLPLTYQWNFGDGSSNATNQSPIHTFSATVNTTYTVTLTAFNSAGSSSKSSVIAVNVPPVVNPPVANFTTNTSSGFSPLSVQFTDTTTGSLPLVYLWNFGDGTSNVTGQNPIHTFSASNNSTYTVTLTAYNSAGSSSKSSVITVNVPPVVNPPVANFTINTTSGLTPLTVQFSDSTTGSLPLAYLWNFGDETSNVITQNPVHTFSATNNTTYTVTLTASNSAGSSSKSLVISVNIPPVGIPPASITDLHNTSFQQTSITWIWTDPSSADFSKVMVYLDGTFQTNVTRGVQTYSALSLTPDTQYTLATHTVGTTGLVNQTWITHLARTAPVVPTTGSVSIQSNPMGAEIFLDGSDTGFITPKIISNLVPGSHMIRCTMIGYNDNAQTISIGPGQTTDIMMTLQRTENIAPKADFSATVTSGHNPLTVEFIDKSINFPTTWSWVFGDGTTSGEQNSTHTYMNAGSYSVKLKVSNPAGTDALSRSGYITVTGSPPTTGSIDVWSNPPGAKISLDYRDTGFVTPKTLPDMIPGSHVIRCSLDGYNDVSQSVDVIAGQTAVVQMELHQAEVIPPDSITTLDNTTFQPTIVTWTWADPSSTNFDKVMIFLDGVFQTNVTKGIQTYTASSLTPDTQYSIATHTVGSSGLVNLTWVNATARTAISAPTPGTYIIKLYPGWNFVSTPGKLAAGSNTANVIFADVDFDHHSPLSYNGQNKTWVQYTTGIIKPLDGIWVYSKYQVDVPLKLDTTSIPLPPSKQVYMGWNAIGETGMNAISARELLTQVGQLDGNWDTLIAFNGPSHESETFIRGSMNPAFSDSKLTYPTKGYWLQMNTNDTLEGLV